jgi:hypothetical protein
MAEDHREPLASLVQDFAAGLKGRNGVYAMVRVITLADIGSAP